MRSYLRYGSSIIFEFPEINEKLEFWCGEDRGEPTMALKRQPLFIIEYLARKKYWEKKYAETLAPKMVALAEAVVY